MIFGDSLFGKILMTFLISMAPVIELRGAIPIGTAAGLDLWTAILVSVLGCLVPVPFILVFIRKIFAWMRKKSAWMDRLVARFEERAAKKSAMVEKYAFWGLFLFTAAPLPGMGAWTGALIASMLGMSLKKAFPVIALGVTAGGFLVAFLTYGAGTLFFS